MPNTAIKRGLAYPLEISNGGLRVHEDFNLIRDAIFSVLETRPGERVMRPFYGTPDFIFDAIQVPQSVLNRIKVCLTEQIPNVEFSVQGSIGEDGAFNVQIYWTARDIPQPPISLQLRI